LRPAPDRPALGSKQDVVVLALAQRGGAWDTVDTEDVAVSAHALAPALFCWRKYPGQIDLDAVRYTLRHAAEGPTARIAGSVRTGWNLTEAGVRWIEASATEEVRIKLRPRGNRAETAAEVAEANRLRGLHAFDLWKRGEGVPDRAAAAVFRVDTYTPARERHLHIQRLRERIGADLELAQFVDALAQQALGLPDMSLDAARAQTNARRPVSRPPTD
jgi:hypothetical protein